MKRTRRSITLGSLFALVLGACGVASEPSDGGAARDVASGDAASRADGELAPDATSEVPDATSEVTDATSTPPDATSTVPDGSSATPDGSSALDVASAPDAAGALDASMDAALDARRPGDAAPAPDDVRAMPDTAAMDAATPDAASSDGGASGACAPTGRWPAPLETFTLPPPNAAGELYIPDVQARFPAVSWATLDRLYVVAGRYTLLNLGNLPRRSAARPLVITNSGGQVLVRPNVGSRQGYLWSLTGGANWVVTGRYDPIARTGDAAFRGHDCGAYARSRGRYGFESDGIFLNEGHMGVAVTGATQFELDYLEIHRSGFAGVRINNSGAGGAAPAPLENVRLHDLYVHDTHSEGFYFGSTQAPPTPLAERTQVYDNRVLRTGTEALQLQNLGDGSEVHHNVFAWGALDWRAAFGNYQDHATQLQFRRGTVRVHHNVVQGGAAALGNYFFSTEAGDTARAVRFEDNYFADTLSLGLYFGGTAGADSSLELRRNFFRGLAFGYDAVYPTATDPGVVLRLAGTITAPTLLEANRWEGSRRLLDGLTGGNGTRGSVTARSNENGAVEAVAFVQSGVPASAARLELWTDRATLAPGMPAMTYERGALVMHDGGLYEALERSSNVRPGSDATRWRRLPDPTDDVRLAPGSRYATLGLGLSR